MGFRTGSYATIWSVESATDTRTKARISISRKNKQTGEYDTDFSGFVDFIGTAAARKALTLKRKIEFDWEMLMLQITTIRRRILPTPTSKSLVLRHRLRSILAVVETPVLTQNLRELWIVEKLMTHSFHSKR